MSKKQLDQFSSRWGLLLAMIGIAIGTGNTWRFPRMAAKYQGGAFLIPWLVFLFLWSIPIILIEYFNSFSDSLIADRWQLFSIVCPISCTHGLLYDPFCANPRQFAIFQLPSTCFKLRS